MLGAFSSNWHSECFVLSVVQTNTLNENSMTSCSLTHLLNVGMWIVL